MIEDSICSWLQLEQYWAEGMCVHRIKAAQLLKKQQHICRLGPDKWVNAPFVNRCVVAGGQNNLCSPLQSHCSVGLGWLRAPSSFTETSFKCYSTQKVVFSETCTLSGPLTHTSCTGS